VSDQPRSLAQRRRDTQTRLAGDGDVEVLEIGELDPGAGDRFATRTGFDPRELTTSYRWFRISPRRVQAWREADELAGRDLMGDGRWLV
jgi:hypothetical protein